MAEGLAYLHKRRIVHADVKPQNLLLQRPGDAIPQPPARSAEEAKRGGASTASDSAAAAARADAEGEPIVKIIDFGLASVVKKKHLVKGQDGTPEYMAPEVVHGKYSFHSDMWSFGVVLFTMLFGFSPFWTHSVYETYHLIVDHGFRPDKPTDGYGNSFPSYISCSAAARDLIVKLLQQDPVKRLTAEEALEHPWLQGLAADSVPLVAPVLTSLGHTHDRTRLQRLVLDMLLETVSDEDIENWKRSLAYVSKSSDGKVTLRGLRGLAVSDETAARSAGARAKDEQEALEGRRQALAKMSLTSPLVRSDSSPQGDSRVIDVASPGQDARRSAGAARGASGAAGAGAGRTTNGAISDSSGPLAPSALVRTRSNTSSATGATQLSSMSGRSSLGSAGAAAGQGAGGTSGGMATMNLKDLLVAAIEHKLLQKEERLWTLFDKLDADGNGVLTAGELMKALHIPAREARQIIEQADSNGDGAIDLDEFVAHFMQLDDNCGPVQRGRECGHGEADNSDGRPSRDSSGAEGKHKHGARAAAAAAAAATSASAGVHHGHHHAHHTIPAGGRPAETAAAGAAGAPAEGVSLTGVVPTSGPEATSPNPLFPMPQAPAASGSAPLGLPEIARAPSVHELTLNVGHGAAAANVAGAVAAVGPAAAVEAGAAGSGTFLHVGPAPHERESKLAAAAARDAATDFGEAGSTSEDDDVAGGDVGLRHSAALAGFFPLSAADTANVAPFQAEHARALMWSKGMFESVVDAVNKKHSAMDDTAAAPAGANAAAALRSSALGGAAGLVAAPSGGAGGAGGGNKHSRTQLSGADADGSVRDEPSAIAMVPHAHGHAGRNTYGHAAGAPGVGKAGAEAPSPWRDGVSRSSGRVSAVLRGTHVLTDDVVAFPTRDLIRDDVDDDEAVGARAGPGFGGLAMPPGAPDAPFVGPDGGASGAMAFPVDREALRAMLVAQRFTSPRLAARTVGGRPAGSGALSPMGEEDGDEDEGAAAEGAAAAAGGAEAGKGGAAKREPRAAKGRAPGTGKRGPRVRAEVSRGSSGLDLGKAEGEGGDAADGGAGVGDHSDDFVYDDMDNDGQSSPTGDAPHRGVNADLRASWAAMDTPLGDEGG